MVVPEFLRGSTHTWSSIVSTAGTPVLPQTSGGAAANSDELSIRSQQQVQTNWCWAAVASSVSNFFDPSSTWSQCEIANQGLGRSDCCEHGGNSSCNQDWYLNKALNITGTFRSLHIGRLSFADIQSEIAAGSPIGCRVGWDGGGGHFLLIYGWLAGGSGTNYIDLTDPIYAEAQFAYDDFADHYHSGGTWTHAFLTGAATAGGSVVVASHTAATPDLLGG